MAIAPQPSSILSVVELTRLIKGTLESGFPAVWVRGELTGCKRQSSGHLYFSLKGKDAVIDCVLYRSDGMRLRFEPRDGHEVEAFGSVTVYEPRGKYQLTVRELRPAGIGALLVALEELKRRLAAEGLFDAAKKRPLPRYPRRVGIVTSPVGAAVRDMVTVMRTRWPSIGIVLAPVRVQGPTAAGEIAAAIQRFNRYAKVDLLIVGRGGGSLEDLWAFNEEIVVRAIAGSRIPVISAVGHEVDSTLADLAADVRAATPSNAGEIAVRDRAALTREVRTLTQRAERAVRHGLERRRRALQRLLEQYGFKRQRDVIGLLQQRIDELLERARGSLVARMAAARRRLDDVRQRYGLREWPRGLEQRRRDADALAERATSALVRAVHDRRRRLGGLGDRLRALSPKLVLERGYCLARTGDGTLVRGVESLRLGELLTLELSGGEADTRVEAVRAEDDDGR